RSPRPRPASSRVPPSTTRRRAFRGSCSSGPRSSSRYADRMARTAGAAIDADTTDEIDFLIITGMSGAGRTHAANTMEDQGWFVIDNLPPSLIPKVAELVQRPGSAIDRVALVVGREGFYLDELAPALHKLR